MAARTLSRAVRNTSLDEWSVLLRETLQNSVDARLSDRRPIHFYVSVDEATSVQRSALKQDVFAELPAQLKDLRTALSRRQLPLLIVADWETRGLGGPTRADLATEERADFRDFFLNVGREESKSYQGGTFGLGRGVLFDISDNGTIVVFTRTNVGGAPVVRLMAMSIGNSFNKDKLKYTGRHWWGSNSPGAWPEPITGRTAERVAATLGLDVMPADKTGTAIMVIAPRLPEAVEAEAGQLVLSEALDEMITAARLYGWPLMVGRNGRAAVRFEFAHAGESWEPESPDSQDSPVKHFVDAYRIAERGSPPDEPTSWHHKEITFTSGRAEPQRLGVLVLRHFPPIDDSIDVEQTGIPESAVALMRDPRMIVKYLKVAKHPLGSSTVGVFVADTAFDHQFAESEPVAHDEWLPAKIVSAKYARNPVKQALDKLKQGVKDTWTSLQPNSASASDPDGIAPVIGDMLGGMVADTVGFSGPRTPPPGNGGGKAVKATRATVSTPWLRSGENGSLRAVFPVRIDRVTADTKVNLRAEAKVVLDGALEAEDKRPQGAKAPTVIGWQSADGEDHLSDRDRVTVFGRVKEVSVVVEQPPDTAVTVMVSASEVAE